MTNRAHLVGKIGVSVVAMAFIGCGQEGAELPTPEQVVQAQQQYRDALRKPPAQSRPAIAGEPTVRDAAATALARIGRPSVAHLIPGLNDVDPAVRARAARVLGRIGPEATEAVGPLTLALEDSDRTVRRSAAQALGQIGAEAEAAVPNLVRLLHAAESEISADAADNRPPATNSP